MYLYTENSSYHKHTENIPLKSEGLYKTVSRNIVETLKENDDLLEITLRQGEYKAEKRVSDSALAEKVILPFHYAKGTAGASINSAPGIITRALKCKVCTAMLPDLQ